jgi:hypothetical protein
MSTMEERSEEQIIDRLFDLENQDQAERRAELSDQRFLSLIEDPRTGRGYVFRHALDETEGAEVPPGTEFWEYSNLEEAEAAFDSLLREARAAGELVAEDSAEELGDLETEGAELNDLYSASDEDPLVNVSDDEDSDELE